MSLWPFKKEIEKFETIPAVVLATAWFQASNETWQVTGSAEESMNV